MLQEVIELQNEAVNNLIEKIEDQNKYEITFKAPTGSGKTHMMASFMDKILQQKSNVVFVVSSLSKGGLAEQNFEKFQEYSGEFKHINPYMITSEPSIESRLQIETDYNVYVLPRDLYKKNSRLKEEGALLNLFDEITKKAPLGQGKEIYLIKDECHIATSNLDELKDIYFSKIINFSATPKLRKNQNPDVQISEEKAMLARLIKKVEYRDDEETLEDAVEEFKRIKEKYIKAAEDKSFEGIVNPCLIIQISNGELADEEVEKVKKILEKTENQSLQWMLIVGRDNEKNCETNSLGYNR